jgi:hypothetical protein
LINPEGRYPNASVKALAVVASSIGSDLIEKSLTHSGKDT